MLPWWGTILRDFFKYSLGILLATAAFAAIMVIIRKSTVYKTNSLIFALISLLPMSIITLSALLLLPDWQIIRSATFMAFPAAFTSLILINKIIVDSNKLKILSQKHRKTILGLFITYIIILSAIVAVLKFENNTYFGELNHPSELSALSFFFTHDHNSTIYIVSWRTNMYSPYFNYNSSHQTLMLWYSEINAIAGNLSKLLTSQSLLINQSQFVMRGMRDSFTYSRLYPSEALLKVVDNEMVNPKFSLIYTNGYYSVHKRAIPP